MSTRPQGTLLWIAVPSGFEGAGEQRVLRLRVVVMPRLEKTTLAASGMAIWPPQELDDASFVIDFASAPDAEGSVARASPDKIWDRAHWTKTFKDGLAVEPVSENTAQEREIKVHPTSDDVKAAERIFEKAASMSVSTDAAGERGLGTRMRSVMQDNPFAQEELPPVMPMRDQPSAPAPPEFHRMIGLLREHPTVMRALGLILELRVPVAGLAVPPSGVVRVRWEGAPVGIPQMVSPWTRYAFDMQQFLPKSTSSITSGVVPLNRAAIGASAPDAPWRITALDIDSAASRLREFAAAPDMDTDKAFPALSTGGLSLVRAGRKAEIENGRERRARATLTAQTELDADDLILGYRLDIQQDGGSWRSLFKRHATYTTGDGTPMNVPMQIEEGHLKPAPALDYGDGVLRSDELMVRWKGWSLAVSQPSFDGGAGRMDRIRRTDMSMHFDFVVPKGSLPRLRFASDYALRLRVADIAGGGLEVDDFLASGSISNPITFRRFEPVASPEISLPPEFVVAASSSRETGPGSGVTTLGPGESVFGVVLRSDRELTAEEFATKNPRYGKAWERIFSPPCVSLATIEQHGMLDKDSPSASWDRMRTGLSNPNPALRSPLPDPAAGGVTAILATPSGASQTPQTRSWQDWPASDTKTLEVSEGGTAAPITMAWRDDRTLVVVPKKAESLEIKISSDMRADFEDHFSASSVGASHDAASRNAARNGNHPMLTPACMVRVTHAVRKPLSTPGGTLTPRRQPGDTYAILDPSSPLLEADAASTAKLEVSAEWTERTDNETHGITPVPVAMLTLGPRDKVLPEDIRHEFGDTRHRRIDYTVTAVSRFRHMFFKDEDEERFLAKGFIKNVSIPNSARPVPPAVVKAYPAFRWIDLSAGADTGVIAHRKREACVRVEFERPWHLSGDGEQIAVIVPGAMPAPAGHEAILTELGPDPVVLIMPEAMSVPAEHEAFLTELGRDPVWGDGFPRRWPDPEQFALSTGQAETVTLPELGAEIIAVPHDVWFDRERWYADIAIPAVAAASYCPLIRLSLARFQRESLPGLSLSPVTRTDFVPLMPDRTLQVREGDGRIKVKLEGRAGLGTAPERVHVVLEKSSQRETDPLGPSVTGPTEDDLPGWKKVASASGELNTEILIDRSDEEGDFRLRIYEVEGEGASGSSAIGGLEELDSRMIFTDLVNL